MTESMIEVDRLSKVYLLDRPPRGVAEFFRVCLKNQRST